MVTIGEHEGHQTSRLPLWTVAAAPPTVKGQYATTASFLAPALTVQQRSLRHQTPFVKEEGEGRSEVQLASIAPRPAEPVVHMLELTEVPVRAPVVSKAAQLERLQLPG